MDDTEENSVRDKQDTKGSKGKRGLPSWIWSYDNLVKSACDQVCEPSVCCLMYFSTVISLVYLRLWRTPSQLAEDPSAASSLIVR
jgi:hypothetical protein